MSHILTPLPGINSFKISEDGLKGAVVADGRITFTALREDGSIQNTVTMTEEDFGNFLDEYLTARIDMRGQKA